VVLSHELRERIGDALDELEPGLRAVVHLVDVEGFPQREVARMLEIPEGTVASRLFRARRILRDRLAPTAHEDRVGRSTANQLDPRIPRIQHDGVGGSAVTGDRVSDRPRRPEGLTLSLRALSALALVWACAGRDRGSREGAWEFRVDTVRSDSAGGIRSTTWLRTVGKEGPRGAPQTEAVILSFDCLPGHTSSAIMTNQALRQGSAEVRLKLDAEPPRRLPGFAGTTPTGGQLVLTIPQDSVLALLSGRQRATIEYADGAGSSKSTAVFSLAGLEKYRAPFLAACARAGGESK
jgi:hypothetical protein